MKKAKIAYLIPSINNSSGMERVLIQKANYLVENFGYQIHLILTEGEERKPFFKLNSEITLHQLDIYFTELDGMSKYKKLVGYFKKQRLLKKRLNDCLCKLKPDITISLLRRDINCINYMTDGSIKLGEFHFNKLNYREFTDNRFPVFVQKLIRKVWMGQLIRELKKLEKFVVLSYEDMNQWSELKNVMVIYNSLPFFPTNQSSCDSKQVIAAGRYMPQKGFDMLIDAWAIVANKHPDWTLRIYGEGFRDELQKQINRLQIHDSCLLEHNIPNISDKYIESSIFVLSSRFEGFGLVIIEAMACGVPPISFACPCGPSEIISDYKDGLLVEPENIVQLADKISFLIDNKQKRKQMGYQARINVERFKIEKIAQQWDELFENLLKEKN